MDTRTQENTTAADFPSSGSRWSEIWALPSSTQWRAAALALFVSLALVVVFYWPTFRSMASLWRTSAFSHGVLVIPTSLYLVWSRRRKLAALTPAPTFWAIPPLVLVAFIWLLGNLSITGVVQQLCLMAMIALIVWGELGTAVMRALLLPIAFLFFAVPFGEGLIPMLQDFSARFAVKALDLSGVPVLLEGRYITVPYGKWEVAEACSGLRFLVASLAVGFLFAGLAYRSWIRRGAFLFLSAVVPVVANGVRVYGIVLLGYFGGETFAARVDHRISGLFFFTLVMILLLFLGTRMREKPGETERASPSPELVPTPVTQNGPSYFAPASIFVIVALLLTANLAPVLARSMWSRSFTSADASSIAPLISTPWAVSESRTLDWKPIFLSPSSELAQTYESGGQTVKLYVAYYDPGQPGGKLVSSGNQLYDHTRWLRAGESSSSALIDRRSVRVHEIFAHSDDSSLVVWHCYWVDGTFTSDGYLAKFLLAKARLFRSHRGAAAVALAVEDAGPRTQGAAILQDFLSHVSLQLDSMQKKQL